MLVHIGMYIGAISVG